MFMQGGVTYDFKAAYDDYSTVKVEDTWVIGQASSECKEQTGSICFESDGWRKIELRVSNAGGKGGTISPSYTGIRYSVNGGTTWLQISDSGNGALIRTGTPYFSFKIQSAKMRANDPTIMDVDYEIFSSDKFVKIRVLAFQDGERSFAKVLRPESFVEGTEINIGDNVRANAK